MKNKIICVAGLGYVGLPSAKDFSKHISVIGFDVDKEKIDADNLAVSREVEKGIFKGD